MKKKKEELFSSAMLPLKKEITEGFCLCRTPDGIPGNFLLVPGRLIRTVLPSLSGKQPVYCLLFDDWLLHPLFKEKTVFSPITAMLLRSGRGVVFSVACRTGIDELFFQVYGKSESEAWLPFLRLLNELALLPEQHDLLSMGYLLATAYRGEGCENILRICDFLESRYTENIPECRAAGMAGLSPSSFSKAFRRVTGCGYLAYLRSIRLRAACALMRDTGRTLSDIALSCGFGTYNQFWKTFQKKFHYSPEEYRSFYRNRKE